MRFPIRRSRLFALALLPFFGATAGRSYLELTHDGLVLRFGWLCHHRFPLDEIEEAAFISGPVPYGPGWRRTRPYEPGGGYSGGLSIAYGYGVTLYSNGFINLVFLKGDVVEVRLKRPIRVRMMLPRVSCERLAVSLEDPEAFLEALAKAGVPSTRSE